jgi:ABC-type phosphate transport system substrate-binding protein
MKKKVVLLCVFLVWTGLLVYPEVLIITHPDTPISSLKKKDVKDIFTGKKTRWGGEKIVIATLRDSEVHGEFLRLFVKKTPPQFKNFWRRKVFTGEGKIPKSFKSEAQLAAYVAATKGAIGYISAPTNKPVKIISIDNGKSKGSKGGRP